MLIQRIELTARPSSLGQWLASVRDHRHVLWILARKDFQVRYKRASFGVLWAVAVPLVQAAVLAVVFTRLVRFHTGVPFAAYVFSGVVAWGYFSSTLPTGTVSIVEASGLTDKVWFPRALLPMVPCIANLVGLGVSVGALLVLAPILGAGIGVRVVLLVPAVALLFALTLSFTLCLSALQVYFRDVRFLVGASLLVWMYVTPIVYPKAALGGAGQWLDFNPMTGVISLFQMAIVGTIQPWHRAVAVTLFATAVLLVFGIEAQRRRDRLFVDLL